ncbi:unnamed protein product [Amoebophrya sp. A120]|nr:unnamed protein product [Amoebophrya sp. A120]|eukprot:GSA120T00010396001.1
MPVNRRKVSSYLHDVKRMTYFRASVSLSAIALGIAISDFVTAFDLHRAPRPSLDASPSSESSSFQENNKNQLAEKTKNVNTDNNDYGADGELPPMEESTPTTPPATMPSPPSVQANATAGSSTTQNPASLAGWQNRAEPTVGIPSSPEKSSSFQENSKNLAPAGPAGNSANADNDNNNYGADGELPPVVDDSNTPQTMPAPPASANATAAPTTTQNPAALAEAQGRGAASSEAQQQQQQEAQQENKEPGGTATSFLEEEHKMSTTTPSPHIASSPAGEQHEETGSSTTTQQAPTHESTGSTAEMDKPTASTEGQLYGSTGALEEQPGGPPPIGTGSFPRPQANRGAPPASPPELMMTASHAPMASPAVVKGEQLSGEQLKNGEASPDRGCLGLGDCYPTEKEGSHTKPAIALPPQSAAEKAALAAHVAADKAAVADNLPPAPPPLVEQPSGSFAEKVGDQPTVVTTAGPMPAGLALARPVPSPSRLEDCVDCIYGRNKKKAATTQVVAPPPAPTNIADMPPAQAAATAAQAEAAAEAADQEPPPLESAAIPQAVPSEASPPPPPPEEQDYGANSELRNAQQQGAAGAGAPPPPPASSLLQEKAGGCLDCYDQTTTTSTAPFAAPYAPGSRLIEPEVPMSAEQQRQTAENVLDGAMEVLIGNSDTKQAKETAATVLSNLSEEARHEVMLVAEQKATEHVGGGGSGLGTKGSNGELIQQASSARVTGTVPLGSAPEQLSLHKSSFAQGTKHENNNSTSSDSSAEHTKSSSEASMSLEEETTTTTPVPTPETSSGGATKGVGSGSSTSESREKDDATSATSFNQGKDAGKPESNTPAGPGDEGKKENGWSAETGSSTAAPAVETQPQSGPSSSATPPESGGSIDQNAGRPQAAQEEGSEPSAAFTEQERGKTIPENNEKLQAEAPAPSPSSSSASTTAPSFLEAAAPSESSSVEGSKSTATPPVIVPSPTMSSENSNATNATTSSTKGTTTPPSFLQEAPGTTTESSVTTPAGTTTAPSVLQDAPVSTTATPSTAITTSPPATSPSFLQEDPEAVATTTASPPAGFSNSEGAAASGVPVSTVTPTVTESPSLQEKPEMLTESGTTTPSVSTSPSPSFLQDSTAEESGSASSTTRASGAGSGNDKSLLQDGSSSSASTPAPTTETFSSTPAATDGNAKPEPAGPASAKTPAAEVSYLELDQSRQAHGHHARKQQHLHLDAKGDLVEEESDSEEHPDTVKERHEYQKKTMFMAPRDGKKGVATRFFEHAGAHLYDRFFGEGKETLSSFVQKVVKATHLDTGERKKKKKEKNAAATSSKADASTNLESAASAAKNSTTAIDEPSASSSSAVEVLKTGKRQARRKSDEATHAVPTTTQNTQVVDGEFARVDGIVSQICELEAHEGAHDCLPVRDVVQNFDYAHGSVRRTIPAAVSPTQDLIPCCRLEGEQCLSNSDLLKTTVAKFSVVPQLCARLAKFRSTIASVPAMSTEYRRLMDEARGLSVPGGQAVADAAPGTGPVAPPASGNLAGCPMWVCIALPLGVLGLLSIVLCVAVIQKKGKRDQWEQDEQDFHDQAKEVHEGWGGYEDQGGIMPDWKAGGRGGKDKDAFGQMEREGGAYGNVAAQFAQHIRDSPSRMKGGGV